VGVAVATMAAVLATSAAAIGAPAPVPTKVPSLKMKAYVPDALLSAVQQNPRASYDVIVQGDRTVAPPSSSRGVPGVCGPRAVDPGAPGEAPVPRHQRRPRHTHGLADPPRSA